VGGAAAERGGGAMTLHFAYGSNMSRALMRVHARHARPLGTAVLDHWRFIITADRYASVVPAPGRAVYGVLWRLTPRDLASLNAYESVDSGLYRGRMLTVRRGGLRVAALVYVGRSRAEGRPRPGYRETVLAAAREWNLPDDYLGMLARWQPSRYKGARAAESGEIA